MFDAIGGRKFIFALLAVFLGFVLVLTKYVTAEAWLSFVNLMGATYILGNIGSDFVNKTSKDRVE